MISQWTATQVAMLYAYALACARPPHRGPVYPFGNTPDNEGEILETVAMLYRQAQTTKIYLQGIGQLRGKTSGNIDYSGCEQWKKILLRKNIPERAIGIIPAPSIPCTHTGTEARDLIVLAKKEKWVTATIVASAFHMPRCLANAVSQAIKHDTRVKIYCVPAMPADWQRSVKYSQDQMTSSPMIDTLSGEVERLGKFYGNALDLEPPEAVLKYLRK